MLRNFNVFNSTVVAILFLFSAGVFAANVTKELSIGGYADAQYRYTKEAASPGFLLSEGALYLKYAKPKVELFVDLPFAGANTLSDLTFAGGKSQAFITLKPTDVVQVIAGQFDAIFGFEAADSLNSSFTQTAALNSLVPTVHTGVMVTASNSGLTGKVLVSNPNNSGTMTSQNAAFGLQVTFEKEDLLHITAGYLGHNQIGAAGMENLYEIMAGTQLGIVALDTQFDIRKVAGTDTGYQFLGHAVAKATEEVSVGARGNWLRKSDGTNYQVIGLTFGPQYAPKSLEGLKLKADYTWTGTEVTSGASRTTEHGVAAAAIYSF